MDVLRFLDGLPKQSVTDAYNSPWICQAVFQALPKLAQQCVCISSSQARESSLVCRDVRPLFFLPELSRGSSQH